MHTVNPHRSSGFTLLEIMVVVVIIGIIATMATLSIGVASRDQGTGREIQRIEDVLALAGEQAVLQGREYGLTFYAHDYEFSVYDYGSGRWQPVENEPPLAAREFPPDAVVELYLEGRPVAVAAQRPKRDRDKDATAAKPARPGKGDDKNQVMPQIFILSSGDVTPFELRLRPAIGKPGITLRVADNGGMKRVTDER